MDEREALVRTYQVQAVRTAYLITGDRVLAEDIVQAAFLRAYQRIGQFDLDRPFRPWFLRSVVNDAIKATARSQRQISLEGQAAGVETTLADLLADTGLGPDELMEQAEMRQAVRAALGKLSPTQRAVIAQRYYLGMSEAEMASSLDCSPGTIKSRRPPSRRCPGRPMD